MQRRIRFLFATAVPALAIFAPVATASAGTGLDLAAVQSRVLADNPELAAFAGRSREVQARTVQAGLHANPQLRTEIENVAGSGAFSGTSQAETTVLLSQSFELGGKRMRRRRAAELDAELAVWDYESARTAVLYEATIAFVDVLAEQQLLALADEAIVLADRVHAAVRRRVDAGSSSRIELTRSEIEVSTAHLERNERLRSLEGARRRLAAAWGATTAEFDRVLGTLKIPSSIPSLEELRGQLDDNPDVVRWSIELARREALVDLESSRKVPDVTLGAGYRRLSEPDEDALVAELSLPLPLFDRNQGNIQEARERVARTAHERRAVEVQVDAELSAAYAALSSARAENRTLDEIILPAAAEAFETLRSGYREGRFSHLEVIDAQRSLIATRVRHLRVLADCHRAFAIIERLTGKPATAGLATPGVEQEQAR